MITCGFWGGGGGADTMRWEPSWLNEPVLVGPPMQISPMEYRTVHGTLNQQLTLQSSHAPPKTQTTAGVPVAPQWHSQGQG